MELAIRGTEATSQAERYVRFHSKKARKIGQTAEATGYTLAVFTGAHFLFYSKNPEADRAFFRDVLSLRSIEMGEGWLIFAMPSSEAAIHPIQEDFSQKHGGQDLLGAVLYLMCDDLRSVISDLKAKEIQCTAIQSAPWGTSTTIPLPSGAHIGLYQPSHPTALNLRS
jgi:hypothetical protein